MSQAWPPLFKMVISGKFDKKKLEAHLPEANFKTKNGSSILHFGVTSGNLETLKYLLVQSDALVWLNQVNQDGETPLHWAIQQGNLDIVRLLIYHGAMPEISDKEGNTPLHWAVDCEDEEMTKELVQQGCKGHRRKNSEGFTPVQLARHNRSKSCVSILTKKNSVIGRLSQKVLPFR